MARYLKLDRDLYGVNGLINLIRGDDWSLSGRVIDQDAANENEVDLTGITGASGFFPAASGGLLAGLLTVNDAAAGRVTLSMPKALTPSVQLSSIGISPYVTMTNAGGLQTLTLQEDSVAIIDRGFTQV